MQAWEDEQSISFSANFVYLQKTKKAIQKARISIHVTASCKDDTGQK